MIVLCPRIIWPVHSYRLPARLRLPGTMSRGLFGPLFDRIQARNERAAALAQQRVSDRYLGLCENVIAGH